MTGTFERPTLSIDQQYALLCATRILKDEFTGVFGAETIERFLHSSYDQFAGVATVPTFLPLLAERFARQRLRALAKVEGHVTDGKPVVVFLCVHNAGRSQMAMGFFQHFAGDGAVAWSGGSEPASQVNPAAIEAMAERGIDISKEFPKPWTDEVVRAADVVITTGCGDACPVYPGKRYEDWVLDDPAGLGMDAVRPIRDEVERRVRALLAELNVPAATATTPAGRDVKYGYDELIVATGAIPARPPIDGLDQLGPDHGVHLLHTMSDTHALAAGLNHTAPNAAVIVGAGYIGLEMAEALTMRGLPVTQIEMLPEVMPTVDPELGRLVDNRLAAAGVNVVTGVRISSIIEAPATSGGRLQVTGTGGFHQATDLVLVVVGVRPDTALARTAGTRLGAAGAVAVDEFMRTGVPHIWAAGDCVTTRHHLLADTYLPLGTTAHKQGRIAGENAAGGHRSYSGSLGTQVVKVFDLVIARTGLRDTDAAAAGFSRPPAPPSRPTTPATTPAPNPSPSASPATGRPAGCWASNSSEA